MTYAIKTLRVAWAEKRWLIRESDGHAWAMMPQRDGWVILPDSSGKLPPAPDGDPVEMRAAEWIANENCAAANRGLWRPLDVDELDGWMAFDGDPQTPGQWAGWLTRIAGCDWNDDELDSRGDGEAQTRQESAESRLAAIEPVLRRLLDYLRSQRVSAGYTERAELERLLGDAGGGG